MGDTYSANDIRATMRTFQEYLRDLVEVKFDQFQTKLRLFINYCEKDDHARFIAQRLHAGAADVREWFASAATAGATPALPGDALGRLAHQYRVLLDLKQQRIDLRNFLSTLFASGSIQEAHARFRQSWLEPMQASFARYFQIADAELGAAERADVTALFDSAFARLASEAAPAARAAAPAPEQAPTTAPPAAPAGRGKKGKAAAGVAGLDVEGLVKLLEKSVKGAKDLAAKVKSDLETDVKILKLELSKHVPDMGVVGRVAEPLQRTGGKIAELAAAIAERARGGAAPR
jgi:hypothetical protein